ncbi:hypothetical protein [Streptomyces sp. NPDC054787]
MTPLVLHLRPGAREWFAARPGEHHPRLVARYKRMDATGSYAPIRYRRWITRQVRAPAAHFDIGPARRGAARPVTAPGRTAGQVAAGPTRLTPW